MALLLWQSARFSGASYRNVRFDLSARTFTMRSASMSPRGTAMERRTFIKTGLGASAVVALGLAPRMVRAPARRRPTPRDRSEEHTSELQSRPHLVCRLLLEKKNTQTSRMSLASYMPQLRT